MKQVTVTVAHTDSGIVLTVDPPDLDLGESGSAVTWVFVGIPNDCVPDLAFADRVGRNLGPFASLRTTPFQLVAEGRSGLTGTFKYFVRLFQVGAGFVAESPTVSLTVLDGKSDPTPMVVVTPGPGESLKVVPAELSLWAGDSVTWRFEGFAGDGWYPRVVFTTGPDDLVNVALGPFASLTRHDASIVGAGNNGVLGSYRYDIAVIDAFTDAAVRIADPALANNGDPPGG